MANWQLTIDCADAAPLVTFWAAALGYERQPAPDGFATWNDWYRSVGVPDEELDLGSDGCDRLRDPLGAGPAIWFQPVPEPKTIKNRIHLDLLVGGGRGVPIEERRAVVDRRVAELMALGGSIRNVNSGTDYYSVTMYDPEGNECCVV